MRYFFSILFLAILLVGCSNLPAQPPSPGSTDLVGRAGGIAIPVSQLPSWAASPQLIDVYPTRVYSDELVTISVGNPYASNNYDYVYTTGYLLDPSSHSWEPVEAFSSGTVEDDWAVGRAGFKIDVSSIPVGREYFLAYACKKVQDAWDCRGGPGQAGKWMLVAFEVMGEYEDVEDYVWKSDIGDYDFEDAGVEDGNYVASYENDVDVDVIITPYDDYDDLLEDVDKTGVWMNNLGGVCGFYYVSGNKVVFWWASGGFKVEVVAYGDELPTDIIAKYGDMYPPECDLADDLEEADVPFCGDGHKDTGEQCDGHDDDACPDHCQFDCTCPSTTTHAVCGNNIRESGEECETDAQCPAGKVCDDCECVASSVCGNNIREAGEECENDNHCPVGEFCDSCQCRAIGAVCGDNIVTPPEDCERDVHCAFDERCLNCSCVPKPVCGNGVLESGEQCENNNQCPAGKFCRNCTCVLPVCGNYLKELGEECESSMDCSGGEVCQNCSCVSVMDEGLQIPEGVLLDASSQSEDSAISSVGQAFARPVEGKVIKDFDQYVLFMIAALAILIITVVNFVELKK